MLLLLSLLWMYAWVIFCVCVYGCVYQLELCVLSDSKYFVLQKLIWSHCSTATGGSWGVWVHPSSPPVTHPKSFSAQLGLFFGLCNAQGRPESGADEKLAFWNTKKQNKTKKKRFVCHVLWLHQRARAHLMLLGTLALLLFLPALISRYVTTQTQRELVAWAVPPIDSIRTSWRSTAGAEGVKSKRVAALCCWWKTEMHCNKDCSSPTDSTL